MNAEIVSSIVAQQLRSALGGAIHLIQPTETPMREKHPWRDGQYVRLPEIACVGRFSSHQLARVKMCGSELVIIWFQDGFGPPIAPDVLEEMQKTPWDRLAHDFDI
ncbi:MAG TPA: hypothetical protein VFO00_02640 [Vitreimonas sp.]|nr:hypothetical protein [Vitreimonas sp.]